MKKVLLSLALLCFLPLLGQKFSVDYNTVIDFDGIKKREYRESGTIGLTDSLLTNNYGKDSLIFKVYKISSNKVYYYNEYDESVKITFVSSIIATRVNETRPNEYVIYRRK